LRARRARPLRNSLRLAFFVFPHGDNTSPSNLGFEAA
jgi:hypothetical protein